jgi:hypothetical protein
LVLLTFLGSLIHSHTADHRENHAMEEESSLSAAWLGSRNILLDHTLMDRQNPPRRVSLTFATSWTMELELDREKLRKEAVEAQRMADVASNEVDRQFWLRISEGWSKLALGANGASRGSKNDWSA